MAQIGPVSSAAKKIFLITIIESRLQMVADTWTESRQKKERANALSFLGFRHWGKSYQSIPLFASRMSLTNSLWS